MKCDAIEREEMIKKQQRIKRNQINIDFNKDRLYNVFPITNTVQKQLMVFRYIQRSGKMRVLNTNQSIEI